jgi:hypothetical protein
MNIKRKTKVSVTERSEKESKSGHLVGLHQIISDEFKVGFLRKRLCFLQVNSNRLKIVVKICNFIIYCFMTEEKQ